MKKYYKKETEDLFLYYFHENNIFFGYCMMRLNKFFPHLKINNIISTHNMSKFDKDEYTGWLIIYEKENYDDFVINREKSKIIEDTIRIHNTKNRHHPEYFLYLSDMTELDLASMVCSMATYCNRKKCSLIQYWFNDVSKNYDFNENQINNINKYIYKFPDIG